MSPYLAQQTEIVDVQHNKTSGEAEWAIIFTANDVLLTVACDHTDPALEEHGVAWSKNASPDVLGKKAWRVAMTNPDTGDSIEIAYTVKPMPEPIG